MFSVIFFFYAFLLKSINFVRTVWTTEMLWVNSGKKHWHNRAQRSCSTEQSSTWSWCLFHQPRPVGEAWEQAGAANVSDSRWLKQTLFKSHSNWPRAVILQTRPQLTNPQQCPPGVPFLSSWLLSDEMVRWPDSALLIFSILREYFLMFVAQILKERPHCSSRQEESTGSCSMPSQAESLPYLFSTLESRKSMLKSFNTLIM